jgi:hypothetical protein
MFFLLFCIRKTLYMESIVPEPGREKDNKMVLLPVPVLAPKGQCESTRAKRVITNNLSRWRFTADDMAPSAQLEMARALRDNVAGAKMAVAMQHVRQKIYGYRVQDFAKNKYNHLLFLREKDVLEMLCDCDMQCYYCHTPVMLIYEDVRDPRQWSIERMDNAHGHNRGNTAIACLQCNLRRRTIRAERYVLTKSIAIVKKIA